MGIRTFLNLFLLFLLTDVIECLFIVAFVLSLFPVSPNRRHNRDAPVDG